MPFCLASSAIFLPTVFADATLPPVTRLALLLAHRGRSRRQGYTLKVVNHLNVNIVQRAVYIEPRTLRRADYFFADAIVHPLPRLIL